MIHENQQSKEIELGDPVARPHYPWRPLRATRPVYHVVEEAAQDLNDDSHSESEGS